MRYHGAHVISVYSTKKDNNTSHLSKQFSRIKHIKKYANLISYSSHYIFPVKLGQENI